MDALILNMNDVPSLLRNDGGNAQNWIKIKLVGTKCNRTAIGARVRVTTGKHTQMNEVHSGTSVMSQSDLRLHFGLGKAAEADVIEVKWPTTQKSGTVYQGEGESDSDDSRRKRDGGRGEGKDEVGDWVAWVDSSMNFCVERPPLKSLNNE